MANNEFLDAGNDSPEWKTFLEKSKAGTWERLSLNLEMESAINKIASQNRRNNRWKLAGAAMGCLALILVLVLFYPKDLSRENGNGVAKKQPAVSAQMQARDTTQAVVITPQQLPSPKQSAVQPFRNSAPDIKIKNPLVVRDKYDAPAPLIPKINDAILPPQNIHQVVYPDSASIKANTPKKVQPTVWVDENDIWDMAQKATNKAYAKKVKQRKDSTRH